MLVLPMLQSFLHFDYAQCDEKDFSRISGLEIWVFGTMYGLLAQTLILAPIAALSLNFYFKNGEY